jgi:hypothetical protein
MDPIPRAREHLLQWKFQISKNVTQQAFIKNSFENNSGLESQQLLGKTESRRNPEIHTAKANRGLGRKQPPAKSLSSPLKSRIERPRPLKNPEPMALATGDARRSMFLMLDKLAGGTRS